MVGELLVNGFYLLADGWGRWVGNGYFKTGRYVDSW